jgi:nucleotide-binding universal stress UspA family protein
LASSNEPGPNTSPEPVLAAIDYSEGSRVSLIWAIDFADKIKAPLYILHVVHDSAEDPGAYRKGEDNLILPIEEIAAKRMKKFMAAIRELKPASGALKNAKTKLVSGLPAKRILSIAKKIKASHLVVGCQGENGKHRFLMGSVAERVVKKSKIPVTTVRMRKKDHKKAQSNQKPGGDAAKSKPASE